MGGSPGGMATDEREPGAHGTAHDECEPVPVCGQPQTTSHYLTRRFVFGRHLVPGQNLHGYGMAVSRMTPTIR